MREVLNFGEDKSLVEVTQASPLPFRELTLNKETALRSKHLNYKQYAFMNKGELKGSCLISNKTMVFLEFYEDGRAWAQELVAMSLALDLEFYHPFWYLVGFHYPTYKCMNLIKSSTEGARLISTSNPEQFLLDLTVPLTMINIPDVVEQDFLVALILQDNEAALSLLKLKQDWHRPFTSHWGRKSLFLLAVFWEKPKAVDMCLKDLPPEQLDLALREVCSRESTSMLEFFKKRYKEPVISEILKKRFHFSIANDFKNFDFLFANLKNYSLVADDIRMMIHQDKVEFLSRCLNKFSVSPTVSFHYLIRGAKSVEMQALLNHYLNGLSTVKRLSSQVAERKYLLKDREND